MLGGDVLLARGSLRGIDPDEDEHVRDFRVPDHRFPTP
jgi:hypothetical protein